MTEVRFPRRRKKSVITSVSPTELVMLPPALCVGAQVHPRRR